MTSGKTDEPKELNSVDRKMRVGKISYTYPKRDELNGETQKLNEHKCEQTGTVPSLMRRVVYNTPSRKPVGQPPPVGSLPGRRRDGQRAAMGTAAHSGSGQHRAMRPSTAATYTELEGRPAGYDVCVLEAVTRTRSQAMSC